MSDGEGVNLSPEMMELALAGAAAVCGALGVALWFAKRRAGSEARLRDEAERRAIRDRDRAAAAHREAEQLRERLAPESRAERATLDALALALRECSSSATRRDLAAALARAVEEALAPAQWMVFLADDADPSRFVLAAAGSAEGVPAWPAGSTISPQTGRVGLAVRRRALLDLRQLDAEPPIVRDQVAATEPAEFRVDVAAPVMSGTRVVAVLTCGAPTQPMHSASAAMRILAEHAAVVLRGIDARDRAARLESEDPITGLGSRSHFQSGAGEAIYAQRCAGGRGALVMLGVDGFGDYVLRNGEQAADRLLRGIAQVIRPAVLERDLIARWRGPEFVVYIDGADASVANALAERMRSSVASVPWPESDARTRAGVTLSAGVALHPQHGATVDDLIAAAAAALAENRAVATGPVFGRSIDDAVPPTGSATQTEAAPVARTPAEVLAAVDAEMAAEEAALRN
ncbi:MAG: hypothetical protein HMLKMBBP_00120 [Planctomycetes bacterium]|nr:hypothetical protein [Planctomycetota bacterium]